MQHRPCGRLCQLPVLAPAHVLPPSQQACHFLYALALPFLLTFRLERVLQGCLEHTELPGGYCVPGAVV